VADVTKGFQKYREVFLHSFQQQIISICSQNNSMDVLRNR